MKEQQPLSIAGIDLEDWKLTPKPVQRLVEALLAQVKQGEVLLKDQSRLTQFLDATPIGIAVHDSTGRLAYVNQVGQELLGIDRHSESQTNLLPEIFQVYRTSSPVLYPVGELPSTLALAGKAAQADDLELHRTNQIVPMEMWATPVLDDRGQVEYAIAAFQDITKRRRSEAERHQIEQALAASESRYRQVVQTQSDFILRSLPDTTITFANDAMCRALGQSLEQVIGQQWGDVAYGEDLPTILQHIAALTREHPSFVAENRDRRADDQTGWTQWLNEGIFNDQGHLVELQSVGRDITALKQAEAARRNSNERYRQVVETMLEGIWMIDAASRTTYANLRMAEMLGYTANEMLGKDLFHFMDESGQAIANRNLERRRQGIKEQHDFRFKTKTGQDIWALLSTNPLYDDAGNYIGALATVTDITRRKEAETLLRQGEQALRQRIDQEQSLSRVVKAIRQSLDLDDIFTTATVEIAHLLQADRSSVVQYIPERQCWKHIAEHRQNPALPNMLETEIPDRDNPIAAQLKQFKVVRIDDSSTLEDEINQKIAPIFPGSWLLVPLIVDQSLWGSFSMFKAKQIAPWTEEQANLVQTIADQLAIAIQQAQAFERAQIEIAERQQAETHLRSVLAEKEVLLKEIHHRVKNNLQIISGLLQLQAQSLQDSPAVHALRESQNRVESMALIHKKLYIASNLEQIDAADYIQSLATSLLTTYKVSPGAIALQVEVEPVILSLDQGIPCGLIINELVSNALKYAFPANQPGEIRIQLRQVDQELELIIQDDGVGLPNHLDLSNIQSLGLSLVYALATEQLEGSLTVDRSQGTAFKMRFPQPVS